MITYFFGLVVIVVLIAVLVENPFTVGMVPIRQE
jgi:hypothetical protein